MENITIEHRRPTREGINTNGEVVEVFYGRPMIAIQGIEIEKTAIFVRINGEWFERSEPHEQKRIEHCFNLPSHKMPA